MTELLLVIMSGSCLLTGILLLRAGSALKGQHPAVTYDLVFPANLEAEPVTRFVSSLSGLLKPWYRRWIYQPVVHLEVIASVSGISHHLVVPESVAPAIEAGLTAHLPSVRYQRVEDEVAKSVGKTVVAAAEYRTNTNLRSLRVDAAELSAGLLSSLQPLSANETVVVQWLLTPAGPVKPPILRAKNQGASFVIDTNTLVNSEAVSALKLKQGAPLLLASCRVVVRAESLDRARALLRHVESPWHGARAPGVHLQRRMLTSGEVDHRVWHRTIPLTVFPMLLNAEEAAGLIGWPVEITALPGLTLGTCRLLPTPGQVPKAGTLIGTSTYPASLGRPVCLGRDARTRHFWVCGPTGAGKSTLLAQLAVQDVLDGHGVVVLDPKGDLIERIAERIPEERWRDVIVLDAADDELPVGYNPLRCNASNRELVVEQCLGVMRAIWKFSWALASTRLSGAVCLR
jgi:hypothetical protein